MSKTIFITGASTGFGYALTEEALEADYNVVATARKTDNLKQLTDKYGDKILATKLDVTDKKMIQAAFNEAIKHFGQVDVLINNAGYGMFGAVEEFSESEIYNQFNTNVFGLILAIQEALPHMRGNKSGHIINISSVAGFVGYPGTGVYSASKHAIEGLSQSLAKEVAAFGIHVTMISPGPFRTNFAGSSLQIAANKVDAYGGDENVHARLDNMKKNVDQNQAGDPIKAAKAILSVIEMDAPPFTLPLGEMAYGEIPKQLQRTLDEIKAVESIGRPTDFPEGE